MPTGKRRPSVYEVPETPPSAQGKRIQNVKFSEPIAKINTFEKESAPGPRTTSAVGSKRASTEEVDQIQPPKRARIQRSNDGPGGQGSRTAEDNLQAMAQERKGKKMDDKLLAELMEVREGLSPNKRQLMDKLVAEMLLLRKENKEMKERLNQVQLALTFELPEI